MEGKIENEPYVLKVEEVAKYLKVSRCKAYELVHSKGFPTIRLNKRILVPVPAFKDWIARNTVC